MDTFESYWWEYRCTLWVLEERLEGQRAVPKHAEARIFRQPLREAVGATSCL